MRVLILATAAGLPLAAACSGAAAQTSAQGGTVQSTAPAANPAAGQPDKSKTGTNPVVLEPVRREVPPRVRRPVNPNAAAAATKDVTSAAWTPEEISTAQAHCKAVLQGIEAVVEQAEPIKEGVCGAPAVVKLVSIGRSPEVTLNPPAVVTCDMVVSLHKWMKSDVQPLARANLGGPVVKLETMSSYSCRNAYGRTRTNLSEHGRANAIDIGGFVTASTDATRVLASWGQTGREARALAAKAEAEKNAAAQAAAKSSPGGNVPGRTDPYAADSRAPAASVPGVVLRSPIGSDTGSGILFGLAPPSHLGGPKPKDPQADPYAAKDTKAGKGSSAASKPDNAAARPDNDPRRSRFLREAHAAACKHFGTVLGPEANDDHKNHFHLDMAPRATGNYCH